MENKIYNRFKKIHDKVTLFRVFDTKLGKRLVASGINKESNNIVLVYYDYDNTILYQLQIDTSGKIITTSSEIDNLAIFSSIYELETILYKEETAELNNFSTNLNMLFEGTFTIYR